MQMLKCPHCGNDDNFTILFGTKIPKTGGLVRVIMQCNKCKSGAKTQMNENAIWLSEANVDNHLAFSTK